MLTRNRKLLIGILIVSIFGACQYQNESAKNNEIIKLETIKFLNGEVKVVGAKIDGKKNGLWLNYNDSGNLESYITYLEDSLLGEELVLNDNGKIFIKHDLIGESINGEWTVYHDYSKSIIAERGKYLNGVKIGVWEYFDGNGSLYLREEYSLGNIKKLIDRRRELNIESFPPNIDSMNSVDIK